MGKSPSHFGVKSKTFWDLEKFALWLMGKSPSHSRLKFLGLRKIFKISKFFFFFFFIFSTNQEPLNTLNNFLKNGPNSKRTQKISLIPANWIDSCQLDRLLGLRIFSEKKKQNFFFFIFFLDLVVSHTPLDYQQGFMHLLSQMQILKNSGTQKNSHQDRCTKHLANFDPIHFFQIFFLIWLFLTPHQTTNKVSCTFCPKCRF